MGYRKLQVYERSYKAGVAIYRMTEEFPEEEKYGITSQIRRAGVSIPLNIAEGYGKKRSQEEFKRFLMMAMGSANEISVLIDFAKDLGYIKETQYNKVKQEYEEIGKMLNVMIKTIENKSKN